MRSGDWLVKLYGWLVKLMYPPSFRRRFGADQVAAFADHTARRARTGKPWPSHAVGALVDLLCGAVAEWWRVLFRPDPVGQVEMRRRVSVLRASLRFQRDLLAAVRMVLRRPAYSWPIIATLSCGVAANATVFSAVKSAFLDPLPFPMAERLVVVQGEEVATGELDEVSLLDFSDLRTSLTQLSTLASWAPDQRTLLGMGRADALRVIRATPALFEITGARVILGRLLQEQDALSGSTATVVLTHGFWQTRLGGDPGVIGQRLLLDGEPFEVVGVLGENYRFPDDREIALYTPLRARPWEARRNVRTLHVLARLGADATLMTAAAELQVQTRRLADAHPETNREWTARLVPARGVLITSDGVLLPLYGAVTLLLVIGCANVSNLLLSRMLQRRRELALRQSLGAGRADLISQLLAETIVLATLAGAFGLVFSIAGVQVYRALVPSVLPGWNPVDLDGGVVLWTLALSAGSALLASLLPALHVLRRSADRHARPLALTTAGTETRRAQRILVSLEIALATVLLAGALLLVQSFRNLLGVEGGFSLENVLSARIELRGERYREDNWAATFDALQQRVAALPDVSVAGLVTTMPLNQAGTDYSVTLFPTGRVLATAAQADLRVANGDYFRALAVPVVSGRVFAQTEAQPVVVINRTLAQRYFPGQNPVGQTLRVFDSAAPLRTIVGVVADVRHRALTEPPRPEIFLPLAQLPHNDAVLVVRTRGEPANALESVRNAVASLDADLPLNDVRTGGELIDRSIAQPRFRTALLSAMALLALALAGLGVYTLLAHSLASRAYELAVRVAIGADPRAVLLLVAREAAALIGIGVLAGSLIALLLTRGLRAALFGVQPGDPGIYLVAISLLITCGLLASVVPAVRALRIDPVKLLNR